MWAVAGDESGEISQGLAAGDRVFSRGVTWSNRVLQVPSGNFVRDWMESWETDHGSWKSRLETVTAKPGPRQRGQVAAPWRGGQEVGNRR